jgi:hypothetical protein
MVCNADICSELQWLTFCMSFCTVVLYSDISANFWMFLNSEILASLYKVLHPDISRSFCMVSILTLQ